MTLFKQMAIAVAVIIIMILATVMTINYQTSKTDMIQNLYETTVNNISTLTSKLAEAGEDSAMIETTIDSEFDAGYYKMIDFKSTSGDLDYMQIDTEPVEGIPSWFIQFSNIQLESVTADVTSGWSILGVVTVTGDVGIVHKALYKIFLNLIYIFIIAVIVSLILLNIMLRFILKPLKDIEVLAKNISIGKFDTIHKLPSTLELQNVSISMNDMSNKIKSMINKLNSNLEKMTSALSKDDLTQLDQEDTFNTDVKLMFIKKQDGYILSIKIDKFKDLIQNASAKVVDALLQDFAASLLKVNNNKHAYRFFGSTFAIISSATTDTEIMKIVTSLQDEFKLLGQKYGISSVAHIGATPFNDISSAHDMLVLANEAYDEAKLKGKNEFFIRDKSDLAHDIQIWKDLVCDIIDNNTFNVRYTNQEISVDGKKTLLLEEAFTSATDKDNKLIQLVTFLSVAQKYNKVIDFDKAIITQVINHINNEEIKHDILINLAFDSIEDYSFINWLTSQLQKNKSIASQLVFSMTAYGCVKDLDIFKKFIDVLHANGAKIILKRFEIRFIPLETLKDFNLDYIRLAREYTGDISTSLNKQNIVESICELSNLLNIKVYAEDIQDNKELETLKELGVYGVSVKHIAKYEGLLTQGAITLCMDDIENNIINISIMTRAAIVGVELLQNMMNYAKDDSLDPRALKPLGSFEVTIDEEYNYYMESKNILSTADKDKVETKLLELAKLDKSGIRKRYRELRKSGENTHALGGGIGFYEIGKAVDAVEYEFTKINEEKYMFRYKATLASKKL